MQAIGIQAPFIKIGAPVRGERVAKLNRLLQVAAEMKEMGAVTVTSPSGTTDPAGATPGWPSPRRSHFLDILEERERAKAAEGLDTQKSADSADSKGKTKKTSAGSSGSRDNSPKRTPSGGRPRSGAKK